MRSRSWRLKLHLERVIRWCFFPVIFFLLAGQTPAQTETEMVAVSVSSGMTPTFSWTPNSAIGRLVVEEGSEEIWSTETDGENIYGSPIRYGVHPPRASEDAAAKPLSAGHTYTVSLFRWISVKPERLQLVGEQEFTPASAAEEDEENMEGEDGEEDVSVQNVTPSSEFEEDMVEEENEEVVKDLNSEEEENVDDEKVSEEKVAGEDEEEDEEEDEDILTERPTLQVNALSPDFIFDGTMNGPAWWAVTDSIANLITIEPEEGSEPEGRTIIKVLASDSEIIVGAYCYDNEPDKIVSFSKARDSELEEEDHILIVLDTFMDGRSGYVFAVNPAGARFDGLVIEQGEEVNSDWDTIWEAKTLRNDKGWSAEIRIPIKSLGYKKGLRSWGFNVQRRVQRLQETSRWSGANLDYEIFQTSQAGLLVDLPEFDFGVGLSIRPATVGNIGRPDGADTETDGDISLDVNQRLGPNLLSSLTVNTDFAETEVDARQTNLTRFDIFFPEKRSFFLEGADIFQFGVALDEDIMIPFFSRRIGLLGEGEDDLPEIPINVGGKINGRVANTNIGALVVNTREVDSLNVGDVDEDIKVHVPQTTMGALRINQNILEESSVGMLATFGDQRGNTDAWMAGVDFTYRTSEFLNEKNFGISVWGLLNDGKDADGEDLSGDKHALGFRIDYPNDLLDMSLMSVRIGDGFQPALGFVPRNDIHFWNATAEVNPRPPWPWLRQVFFELSGSLYNNLDNSEWESYEVTIKPLDWLLESGDQFEAGIAPEGDRPPEAFEVASDVDIPSASFAGAYNWTRFFVGAKSAQKRKIGTQITWEFGDFYNGDLSTVEASVSLRPSAFLTVEFTGERNTGKVMALPEDVEEEDATELVQREFTEEVYGVRLLFNFSPDLQLSSFTQYDNESKELGSNNRLRWTFHPLGDLFIVYNHNLLQNDEDKWEFVSNELPVKLQYTWRF